MAKKESHKKETLEVDEVEGLEEVKSTETKKKEDLVEVEMTAEQRDAFVKFMSDSKDKLKEVEEGNKEEAIFVMDLAYEHNLNGQKFGPGLAHIPQSMVPQIQRGELRSMKREIRLHTSNNRMFKVLQSGQAVPVRAK